MINLELSEQHAGLDTMMREVAKSLLRPISRMYDMQEHDVPVLLKVLDRRPPPSQRPPSQKPEESGAAPEKKERKKPETVQNGNNMSTVVNIMQITLDTLADISCPQGMICG